MAPPFVFPRSLQDLEYDGSGNTDQHPAGLTAVCPIEVPSLRPGDIEELAGGLAFDLSDRDLQCVEDQDVFDRLYSLVRHYSCLGPASRAAVVEALSSNLGVLLPALDSLARAPLEPLGSPAISSPAAFSAADRLLSSRNALRIYTFFLLEVVLAEESTSGQDLVGASSVASKGRKKNPPKGWNWESVRARILSKIANSLDINPFSLFGSTDSDENHLSYVSRCVFSLYENQSLLRNAETCDALSSIVSAISTKHRQHAQTCAAILHLAHKFDFAVPHLADAISSAEKKYGDGTLASTVVRDIGRTDPKEYVRDTVGAENVGRLLVELADRSPKVMATNVGLLVPHFGGESYKIRNALVGVLGKLVIKAFKDIDGDSGASIQKLRGKQAMLSILIERCRDTSAYTRSRVLQIWAELCEEHAVSIGHWNEVACVAAGRLEDKSAFVRKSALCLLITMLQHNPFGPQLRVAAFEATLEKYKGELQQMEIGSPPAPATLDEDTEELSVSQAESVPVSCSEEGSNNDLPMSDVGNCEQTRVLVASLEAGLRFSKCISSLMPTLVHLLASSSATDVEYTIHLLIRCRQFQIDGSDACLLRMLPLAFSSDKSVSEAVEQAFVQIYLSKSPFETAKNLLSLAIDSNIGDLAALEFLVASLMSKGEISSSVVAALWDFFSFNIKGVTSMESQGALSILCMAAKSSPGILSTHMHDIVDIGFGRWAREEPLLARTACAALEKLSDDDKEVLRSYGSGKIFGCVHSLITGFALPDHIWYAAADKAISLIYTIHPMPELYAIDLIKTCLTSIVHSNQSSLDSSGFGSETDDFYSSVPVAKLSKFLFVVSHVALNHLAYVEICIRKIQKQKSKKDCLAHSPADQGESAPVEGKEDTMSAELGLNVSDDMMVESLFERTEKEIVSSGSLKKNLVGFCAPFISKLCRNYTLMQKYPGLQASAMLALCRLMIIDADFCEANLQLLFTVVESASSETVRSNCTLALGDLAVRYPNLIEPWTKHIYARLQDSSVPVRKNAVLVLSHLILNDMMKVKGYIDQMVLRIEDDDERISSLAKLFFHELSKKGNNPIYNLLPDILGKLGSQNLKKEMFCSIMQFLINFIKKDKQMDTLVEKLCSRFSGVTDTQQWEHIAYCLSQLTFTEKGMRKFMESFRIYEHVLCEEFILEYFKIIISKGKKCSKLELKSSIEEYEEKVYKAHIERKEIKETTRAAQEHQSRIESCRTFLSSTDDKCTDLKTDDDTSEVINPVEVGATISVDSKLESNIDEEIESNSLYPPKTRPVAAGGQSVKKSRKGTLRPRTRATNGK